MSNLIKKYSQIANNASGLITLGLVQAIVMAAGAAKVNNLAGIEQWGMRGIIFLSTAGFAASCFGIAMVINGSENTSRWERFVISVLFYPVLIGMLLSAIITAKAIL